MSLSGCFVQKGLVSRSALSKSTSHEDLAAATNGVSDAIQVYLSSSSRSPPIRMLAADPIRSVNLKIRGTGKSFYTRSQCIVSGADAPPETLSGLELSSAGSMRFILGLADISFISVTTFTGKEYVFSVERNSSPSVRDLKERVIEEEQSHLMTHDLQLVPASGGAPLHDADILSNWRVPGVRNLHLIATRNSRVQARPTAHGSAMELSVHVSPTIFEDESTEEVRKGAREREASGIPEVIHALRSQVNEGLVTGFVPRLTEEGSGGTYFMPDADGKPCAVFKPMDEEPLARNCPRGMTPSANGEGLKKGTMVGEGALREVAAYLLDRPSPAKLREHDPLIAKGPLEGFSGVPPTVMAEYSTEFFPQAATSPADDDDRAQEQWHSDGTTHGVPHIKQGSLQQFVHAESNCEDMGPRLFPVREVHKVAVLDMRIANADRNGANILVQRNQGGLKLVPIDHGYCLPESLEECTFEWLYWPQASVPFDEETVEYIKTLDAEDDIALLAKYGWNMSVEAARVFISSTTLLRKGTERGLTPFDIGSLMVRSDYARPCALEDMMEDALAKMDREGVPSADFGRTIARVIEDHLTNNSDN